MRTEEDYKRYGFKCSEANLATLPDSAPQGVKDLTKWLTLEGRRSSLEEYLGCVQTDSRIHGKFWHIGAWTGRMSHSAPNQANIASVFQGTPKTPVEEVKNKYDKAIRSLFKVPTGSYLLGTDADAIQLRILAHYIDDPKFTAAVSSGKKEDGTDIHTMNKIALGPICKDRDTAKTFVYAWLLGAGTAKVAQILGCTTSEAKAAIDSFVNAYPGLKRLKSTVIPRDAARGYFIGLDGRKVKCDSEHHMLSGYLQNGESVVVKMWVLKWVKEATEVGILFKVVDVVHDEVQVEVPTEVYGNRLLCVQERVMAQVGAKLKLKCPLAVSGKLALDWGGSH